MARGDQIYVMRPLLNLEGVYEHHGIDCGDGTVIHYSKAESEPTIRRTSWKDFSWGNPVSVKSYMASFIPDVVMERAESRLGERQYNLLTNNCEHFAAWCKVGKNESSQISNFGLPSETLERMISGRTIEAAAHDGDPLQTLHLFDQAVQNTAIAQMQLEAQYHQAQSDADTWHRVALLALKQGKEAAARAALGRKVEQKRRIQELERNMTEMEAIAQDLRTNVEWLQKRAAIETLNP